MMAPCLPDLTRIVPDRALKADEIDAAARKLLDNSVSRLREG